jgi:hypothetical protein
VGAGRLGGIPFTEPENGRVLYDFILDNTIEDSSGSPSMSPRCSLRASPRSAGSPGAGQRSCTWELYRLLAETPTDRPPRQRFDSMFHDADHTGDNTSWRFLLGDVMLRPGGAMLFDDYEWTIHASEAAMRARYARSEGVSEELGTGDHASRLDRCVRDSGGASGDAPRAPTSCRLA